MNSEYRTQPTGTSYTTPDGTVLQKPKIKRRQKPFFCKASTIKTMELSSDAFGLSTIRAVPLPMPKPTLIGYIIIMGFIVAIFVRVLFSFSENPLATIVIIVVLLAVAAVVTFIFVKLFAGLDQKRESVSRPPIGIASPPARVK